MSIIITYRLYHYSYSHLREPFRGPLRAPRYSYISCLLKRVLHENTFKTESVGLILLPVEGERAEISYLKGNAEQEEVFENRPLHSD